MILYGSFGRTSLRTVGGARFQSTIVTANDNPHAPTEDVPVAPKVDQGFRELFLKPKRKLQSQIAIERLTGRAEQPKVRQFGLSDRLSVRRPRREDQRTDQDWTAVWPAAASFRESVVPLPIRMGFRRKPSKRPPFQTYGNLELLKIPNFLHLTPQHIAQHCAAIAKFCTPFPPELKATPELARRHLPLTYTYSDYVHQGTSLRDIRARVVTVTVAVVDFLAAPSDASASGDVAGSGKDDVVAGDVDYGHARDKLIRLLGSRYDPDTDSFTITADRCMTRQQNRDYVDYVLAALFHESHRVESWEASRQRVDALTVEYAGSATECHVAEVLARLNASDSSEDERPKVEQFKTEWSAYRNEPETPETVRRYEDSVRSLLGIEKAIKN